MINFGNKKIIITGATGGIGNELVKKFVSLKGKVLATGTNEEKQQFLLSMYKNDLLDRNKALDIGLAEDVIEDLFPTTNTNTGFFNSSNYTN